jgi:hypothetical protein
VTQPTYKKIIERYPILTNCDGYNQWIHESMIIIAYLAGHADAEAENIERETAKYLAAYRAAQGS